MFKYKCNKNVIIDGRTYKPNGNIVVLPVEHDKLELIEEEEKTDWKQLGIDAGLEGEELKKFMKKSTANRQIQLDKLKEK